TGAQIKAGRLVPVAVSSRARHPAYPAIPTFAEQDFPDVRGDTWFWLAGPRNLPKPILERLNSDLRKIMASSKMRAHIEQLALLTMDLNPDEVARFVGEEYAFWAPLAKEVGLAVQ